METVNQVVSLSELARKHGLLGFEEQIHTLENEFQKSICKSIVDGLDKDHIRKSLDTRIVASGASGVKLLKMIIFGEGVLDILIGNSPRVTREYLIGFIGDDAVEYWYKQNCKNQNQSENSDKSKATDDALIKSYEALKSTNESTVRELAQVIRKTDNITQRNILELLKSEECYKLACDIKSHLFIFEDIIKLDNSSLNCIIRDINFIDLSKALNTASDEVKEIVFKHVSLRRRKMLEDDMENLKDLSIRDSEEAQVKICDIVRKKHDDGLIYVHNDIII